MLYDQYFIDDLKSRADLVRIVARHCFAYEKTALKFFESERFRVK